jgi:hypothetical protein
VVFHEVSVGVQEMYQFMRLKLRFSCSPVCRPSDRRCKLLCGLQTVCCMVIYFSTVTMGLWPAGVNGIISH